MTALEPATVISGLGVALLAIAGLLAFLPVGTCRECPHCRLARLARERERENHLGDLVGLPMCRVCGLRHGPDEDHPSQPR